MKKKHLAVVSYARGHEDGYEVGFVAGARHALQDVAHAVIHGASATDALGAAVRKIDEIEAWSKDGRL